MSRSIAVVFAAALVGPGIAAPPQLKVSGTHLVNEKGERVRLRGVNCASMEWTSDGEKHILDTVKAAIQDWKVNVVRLPLSQDRWFGKAPEQKDEGKAYRDLVKKVIDFCSDHDCYVMPDLHWSDAGEWGKTIGQHCLPDRGSLAFWKDFAPVYKNNPAVIFDLYNEPFRVTWDEWKAGGKVTERGRTPLTYDAVGMPALFDAVRTTGAKNVVVLGGLDWSYDMSGFLKGYTVADPTGNGVVYANHAYPNKGDTVPKWVAKMKAAAEKMPVLVGEFGAEQAGPSAPPKGVDAEQWVKEVLAALEENQWDWIAWDLHPFAGPRLVSDWNYTPTPKFGKHVKDALLKK
jgi:endoglucanase